MKLGESKATHCTGPPKTAIPIHISTFSFCFVLKCVIKFVVFILEFSPSRILCICFVKQGAKGFLAVPLWKSASYWPILAPNGRHFARFVTRYMKIRPFLLSGPDLSNSTFKGFPTFDFVVMRINGENMSPWEFDPSRLNCLERGCALCAR